jgi:acyl-CoA synthetase (AMP-forming)/AMP-acid ligase II
MLPLPLHCRSHNNAVALVAAGGRRISYHDLYQMLGEVGRLLDCPDRALVAIFVDRDLDSVVAYLATLSLGHACGFFGALPAVAREVLIETYQPEFVVRAPDDDGLPVPGRGDYRPVGRLRGGAVVWRRTSTSAGGIAADLALLLATSGSTGSPVVVRLSWANLRSNAMAIVAALGITAADRAITSLPLSHCYGLSVLNSHLAAGASVVICPDRVLGTRFWRSVARDDVTSFAGVPVIYEALHGRHFDLTRFPALSTLTYSGGPLAPDVVGYFAELMERRGGQFWVMYGQTEATARITCLPPQQWRQRPGSVGRVVPGGRLWIEDPGGAVLPEGEHGAVIYAGPAVMLGYARSRGDLGTGDVLRGKLATGDLGYLREGYLYLTGRAKRIAKVLGFRVELDQVEAAFGVAGPAAAVRGAGETIVVFAEGQQGELAEIRAALLRQLSLPPGVLALRPVREIPVTRSGKPDYQALSVLARAPRPTMTKEAGLSRPPAC